MKRIIVSIILLSGLILLFIFPIMISAQSQPTKKAEGEVRFGRAKKRMAPEYVEFGRFMATWKPLSSLSYYAQMNIHRAHVVMLTEQNILTREEAATILKGLKKVDKMAAENEALKPYMATEGALIKEIGNVGGKMHIGRSRNDLMLTEYRIYYRDQINRLIESLIYFQKALTKKARENTDVVMTAHTHRKQAQPVTLGHYLLAHVEATGKSIQRFEDLYKRTNLNPLGGAATAGTGWPINRQRTAELLGFDGLVLNSQESVAGWDFIAELAAAMAIHMSNMSRLASEIQSWSSDEFATVDLDESYTGTSSIMPQKKNPTPLELTRLSANECLGAFVGILSSLNGGEYQFFLGRGVLEPHYIDITVGATKVMAGVVSTMKPSRERMLLYATEGFSTMTELADTLVRNCNISFREAHDIIAQTVLRAVAEGKTANQITADMIQKSAIESIGKKLNISDSEILAAINPTENVLRRNVIGGPAPQAVQQMIDIMSKEISSAEIRHKKRVENIKLAYDKLQKAEASIVE
jgi:argininosuccinate lyase